MLKYFKGIWLAIVRPFPESMTHLFGRLDTQVKDITTRPGIPAKLLVRTKDNKTLMFKLVENLWVKDGDTHSKGFSING